MEKDRIFKIAGVGVFSALVFVASMISIPIPVAIGDVTRIHLGNIFCLISGLILGPVSGGLSAGIGSMLYDFTNPAYISSAGFTLVFKFMLAFTCGLIAYYGKKEGKSFKVNLMATIAGSLVYMVLYLSKSFVEGMLLGNTLEALMPAIITKAGVSLINAIIAVVVSVSFGAVIRSALDKSGLLRFVKPIKLKKATRNI